MRQPYTPHERYNPLHPLLRELVFVHVDGNNGESFDVLLTRVPAIGEEISREDRSYRATRVRHEPVDDDGRARFGWHAFVEADLQPPDEAEPRHRRGGAKKAKGSPRRRESL